MALQRRPSCSDAISVVPEPENGSYTRSPGWLELLMPRATRATGFMVGCSSLFFGRGTSQTLSRSRRWQKLLLLFASHPYVLGRSNYQQRFEPIWSFLKH